jgi:1-acyl-sn-glycerol-3-phosphate acyltransferase
MVAPKWVIGFLRGLFLLLSRVLWSLQFKGVENIPSKETGGIIIAANHQTYIDPFWLSLPVKRPIRYLAWNEAFAWPVVGKIMSFLGAWPLQLEKGSPRAMRRSLKWLGGGGALVIFPEGARCFSDGEMLKFKAGAVRLAIEAGMPILPVTIKGANKVWPRDYHYPKLSRIEVTYHPLQYYSVSENQDLKEYTRHETERLAKIIASAL